MGGYSRSGTRGPGAEGLRKLGELTIPLASLTSPGTQQPLSRSLAQGRASRQPGTQPPGRKLGWDFPEAVGRGPGAGPLKDFLVKNVALKYLNHMDFVLIFLFHFVLFFDFFFSFGTSLTGILLQSPKCWGYRQLH